MQQNKNAWKNGTFYIFVLIVVVTILSDLSFLQSLFAIMGCILIITLIGAIQLRMNENLSEKSFLYLLKLVFSKLPIIEYFIKI